jgi:hypothetical protein
LYEQSIGLQKYAVTTLDPVAEKFSLVAELHFDLSLSYLRASLLTSKTAQAIAWSQLSEELFFDAIARSDRPDYPRTNNDLKSAMNNYFNVLKEHGMAGKVAQLQKRLTHMGLDYPN